MIGLTGFWLTVSEACGVIVIVTTAVAALWKAGPLRWLGRRLIVAPAAELLDGRLQPLHDGHASMGVRLDTIDGRLDTGACAMDALRTEQTRFLDRFDRHEIDEREWREGAEAHRHEQAAKMSDVLDQIMRTTREKAEKRD